jgi:site-specific recombinase XerC
MPTECMPEVHKHSGREMTSEQRDRAKKVKSIRGERLPAGRDLAPGEIAALMGACAADEGPAGVRDAALIGLRVTVGFRIAETAMLALADYERKTGELVLNGKGRKQRKVHAQNGAKDALDDWIELRGDAPGPLFTQIRKGGEITDLAVSTTGLQRILAKRQAQAGVARFTWHDMRRKTAGDLLDVGADIVTVQKILGHSSPATTARYDRRPEEAKRKAISLLHVPYHRSK